jgi:UDP-glucose 4-epimerase
MSRVLITGAEGMIGSRLSKHLTEHGHDVTEWEGDVTVWDNWIKYCDRNWDYVIHLAALAGVRTSFEQPDIYYHNNVVGTHMALEFNKMMNAKMLYASSSNAAEWWGNPYAATKKMNEAQALGHMAIGMRFHTVWPGRDDMLFRMLQRGEVTYINQAHYRDFIHVADLVEGIRLTMDNFEKVYLLRPVVDYGTGHSTSVESVAKVMGFDGEYRNVNPPGERVRTQANIEWLLKLGWTPQRNILDVNSHTE